MGPTSPFAAGAIKVVSPPLPVVYATPRADAVADLVATTYDLPGPIACTMLYRGWNDLFEIRTKGAERFVFVGFNAFILSD